MIVPDQLHSLYPYLHDLLFIWQEYSTNIYLCQIWRDHRLEYQHAIPDVEDITLPDIYYQDIWIPDPYVENGISEVFHAVTQPNKMFRVYKDGMIRYSQR